MGCYEIRWKTSAVRELKKIDPQYIPKIIGAVEALAENPFPPQHRKLRGSERNYRIRVGDYRIIYQVDIDARLITIYYVRHRRKAYRW
ncbi:MAG: type II toxin-antitoxin system RelE/ParE family toxin [Euryarchaeota archaeon]|nr:type II toxin-antitoxin system RelE/ParE family toxin [Euryarchaeota archaeon]